MKMGDLCLDSLRDFSYEVLFKNLKKLRSEIVLNSIYYADFKNSFGIDEKIVAAFFDGYVDFLFELADEANFNGGEVETINKYDTTENICDWYICHDDFGDEDYPDEEEENNDD